MRFKKGTKVEVLITSSVPYGAWRSAEIVSGNGHYYTIIYDGDADTVKVPRKSMRPKPPPSQVLDSWANGDVLEVFESCMWKMAIVSKALEKDCFLIRLLGSSMEVKARKTDTRVRQSWQDNEWITLGSSRASERTSTGKLKRKVNSKGDYVSSESKDKLDESDVFSAKGPKGEEEDDDDRESVASSVGSCSIDMGDPSTVSYSPKETANSSDTESSSCGYKKLRGSRKGSEESDAHRLELDTYRCSIKKLHASGPVITWEQETWITNLRLRLNITNEEHLLQIRNLISDDNSSTYR